MSIFEKILLLKILKNKKRNFDFEEIGIALCNLTKIFLFYKS